MMGNHVLPVRDGTISVDGCELAWSEQGAGQPVLFIHGTGASVWGDLFALASGSCRAIRYDRRGFGASLHAPVDKLSRHAQDAARLLEARDGRGAVIVGWSIGGVIAAELAIRHPELVAGLVLLEPPLWAKKHPDLNLFNGVVLSTLLGLVAGPRRGGLRFSRWVMRERSGGNSLDTVDPRVREQIAANAAAIGVEIRGGTGEHLSSADFASIRVPTEVFAADRSQQFLVDGARRMADAIPNARFSQLNDATHFLQLEHAGPIVTAIARVRSRGQAMS
jgi:pimeloyl-ACP methyl ester carboxylesterase